MLCYGKNDIVLGHFLNAATIAAKLAELSFERGPQRSSNPTHQTSTRLALTKAIPRKATGTRSHAYAKGESGITERLCKMAYSTCRQIVRRFMNISSVVKSYHNTFGVCELKNLAEGVLVAKKDFNLPKHQEIDTKNLYVRFPLFSAFDYSHPLPAGHQSMPISYFSWLSEDSVLLAMVLLHAHTRRS